MTKAELQKVIDSLDDEKEIDLIVTDDQDNWECIDIDTYTNESAKVQELVFTTGPGIEISFNKEKYDEFVRTEKELCF